MNIDLELATLNDICQELGNRYESVIISAHGDIPKKQQVAMKGTEHGIIMAMDLVTKVISFRAAMQPEKWKGLEDLNPGN